MQSPPPTTTSIPSINISSDRMAARHEPRAIGSSRPKHFQRTALAALCQPNLRPCAHRSSPKSLHSPEDWISSARLDTGVVPCCPFHLQQVPYRVILNRRRYVCPRQYYSGLLFPPGHLLCLHGYFYLALPRRNGPTHSSLSIPGSGKKRSPGGWKISRRLDYFHRALRGRRDCLLLPYLRALWCRRQILCL